MGFWEGVADWMGINPDGPWYKNLGAVLSGGLYQADEDYSSAGDYFKDQGKRLFTPLGPIAYGAGSSLNDAVSDLSEKIGSIDDMKSITENLADALGGKSDSDLINRIFSYFTSPGAEADLQRDFNREEADLAVERARELRRTQYIDAVQGLRAAGLNPVLAAGGGIGSSSSVAPMATSSAAQGTRAVDVISSLALLLQSITGGISSIADAFGSHKTVVNKTYNNLRSLK